MSWFEEMKRKTMDSQELEAIDEVPENSEANINNSEDNIDNNEDNIDSNEDNIDKSESISNLVAQLSTFSSSYKRPSTSTSVPNPKRKRIAQVTSLVNEIRSIKEDLKKYTRISDENVHDIFGKFVASQLKRLSTTQAFWLVIK